MKPSLFLLFIVLVLNACVPRASVSKSLIEKYEVFALSKGERDSVTEEHLPSFLSPVGGAVKLVTHKPPGGSTSYYLIFKADGRWYVLGQWDVWAREHTYDEKLVHATYGVWKKMSFTSGWGTGYAHYQTAWYHLSPNGAQKSLSYTRRVYSEAGDGTERFLVMEVNDSWRETPDGGFVLILNVSKSQDPPDSAAPRLGILAYEWDRVDEMFNFNPALSTWPQSEHDNPW